MNPRVLPLTNYSADSRARWHDSKLDSHQLFSITSMDRTYSRFHYETLVKPMRNEQFILSLKTYGMFSGINWWPSQMTKVSADESFFWRETSPLWNERWERFPLTGGTHQLNPPLEICRRMDAPHTSPYDPISLSRTIRTVSCDIFAHPGDTPRPQVFVTRFPKSFILQCFIRGNAMPGASHLSR